MEPETPDLARDMSTTSSPAIDNTGIPSPAEIKEYFINEDYGNIELHILRRKFFREANFDVFNDRKYIISDVISFNINKNYHFINNETKPCIYFSQISEQKENNDDMLFFNTILTILRYKSISNDPNDEFKYFIETLFNNKLEVIGYRFWCFYLTMVVKSDDTIENNFCEYMKTRRANFDTKRKTFTAEFKAASKPKNKSADQIETITTRAKLYKYLSCIENKSVFEVIREYLRNDPASIKKNGSIVNNGFKDVIDNNNKKNPIKRFNDDLLTTYESKFTNDSKFLSLLSKESSMVYFNKDIIDNQTDLSQYFNMNKTTMKVPNKLLDNLDSEEASSHDDEDVDDSLTVSNIDSNSEDRLNKLRDSNIKNLFKAFPYPNAVYEIDPGFLLPEIFFGLPLPHSINTCLSIKSIIGQDECSLTDINVIGLNDTFMIPDLQEFYSVLDLAGESEATNDMKKRVDKDIQDSYLTDSNLLYRINCIKTFGRKIFVLIENNIGAKLNKFYRENVMNTALFSIKKDKYGFSESKLVFVNETILDQLEDYRNSKLASIQDVLDDDDNNEEGNEKQPSDIPDPLDNYDDKKKEFYEYCQTKPPVHLRNLKDQSPENSWWAQVLKKYTPRGLVFSNINELHKHSTSIPLKFIEFDFALRLQILNKVRWAKLKQQFPYRHIKKAKQYIEYDREYRKVQDAMAAECFYYFFTCDPKLTSDAFVGIRDWILLNENGFRISDPHWKMNIRPFGQFMTWVVGFLNSFGQISQNLKIAILLYFCKFHHARYFSIANLRETNKVKLNVLLLGDGMSGKSHIFKVIQFTIPANDKCVRDIMHSTAGCNNVDGNYDGYLRLHDEFNAKLWMDGGDHPETREQLKNILTSHKSETLALVIEKLLDDDGNSYTERKQVSYKASSQMVLICASNNNAALADQNVLTRFLVLKVPKLKKEADEANANHFKYNDSYNDIEYSEFVFKQQQVHHANLVVMEMMIKSGVFEDYNYGVEINGGEAAFEYILDTVQRKSGINTADHRKRVHQLEIARSMALAYACWMGNVSPFTQYLFSHNGKNIGFNHRILTMGIIPWAVVTSDQVAVVSQLLNFNYQETDLEEILDIFVFKICKLVNTDDNAACFHTPKNGETDYSYVYKIVNSLEDLARDIQHHMKYKTTSTHNIQAILIELSKRGKKQYSYRKDSVKDTYLYLKKDKTSKKAVIELRPVVKIEKFGQRLLVFVSVSFLKETFPRKLNSKVIEDDTDDLLSINRNIDLTSPEDELKNIDLDSCYTLSTNINTNPFAYAFKEYYENKYLGYAEPYFVNDDKLSYMDAYKIKHNNKLKLPPLRYVTTEAPKDYLLSFEKLPPGLSNIVKLDKVLSVIELNMNNNKNGIIEYNLQTYLPSDLHGLRDISCIQQNDGTWKIIKMDDTVLNNNKNFKREQKCDHDWKACDGLLRKLHFPGYEPVDENKCINWPIITFHLLMNDFLSEDRIIRHSLEDKFLYPEVNIEELVKQKKEFLSEKIAELETPHIVLDIVIREKNKSSILKFGSNSKKLTLAPPNEVISHHTLKKKLDKKLEDQKNQKQLAKEAQLNLNQQMDIHMNSYLTPKTSSSLNNNKRKEIARLSDEAPKKKNRK